MAANLRNRKREHPSTETEEKRPEKRQDIPARTIPLDSHKSETKNFSTGQSVDCGTSIVNAMAAITAIDQTVPKLKKSDIFGQLNSSASEDTPAKMTQGSSNVSHVGKGAIGCNFGGQGLMEEKLSVDNLSDTEDDIYKTITDLKNFEETKPFPECLLVKVVEMNEKQVTTMKDGAVVEKMDLMCADSTDFLHIEIRDPVVIGKMYEGKLLAFENIRFYKNINKAIAFDKTSAVAVVQKMNFPTIPRPTIPSLKSVALADFQKSLLKISKALLKDQNDKKPFSLQGRIVKVFPVELKTLGDGRSEVPVRNILLKDENDIVAVGKLAFWREKAHLPFVEGQYVKVTNLYCKNFYDGFKIINARADTQFSVIEWDGEEISMDVPSELIQNATMVTELKIYMILSSSYFYPACPEKDCSAKSLLEEPKGTFNCQRCNGVWTNEANIKQGIVLKIRGKVAGDKETVNLQIFNESVQMMSNSGKITYNQVMDVEMLQSRLHDLPLKVRGRRRPNKNVRGSGEDVFTITSVVM